MFAGSLKERFIWLSYQENKVIARKYGDVGDKRVMSDDEIESAGGEFVRERIDNSYFIDEIDARFLLREQQVQSRQARRTKIGQ